MHNVNRKFSRIIPRSEWGAEPAKSEGETLRTPVKHVVLVETLTEECDTQESCTKIIKDLQKMYMEEKGLDDIPWSFIVGGDQNLYEGRGWTTKPIKTDRKNYKLMGYDGKSLDIAYIGTFDRNPPGVELSEPAMTLVDEGVRLNMIEDNTDFDSFIKSNRRTLPQMNLYGY